MDRGPAVQQAVQLTLYVAEPHVRGRQSAVDELIHRAAAAGVAGGTVLAAYQGFGRRHNDEPTFWHRPQQTPLTVIFTDTAERVEQLLTLVDELLPDAVAVTKQVRSVHYPRPLTA
jgi:PII-like signaling protein